MRFSDDNTSFFVGHAKGKIYEYNASNFAKRDKPRKIKIFDKEPVSDIIY